MHSKLATALAVIIVSTGTACAQDARSIRLSQQQVERLGITVQNAEKADSVALVDLIGRVTRAPAGMASITAPFAGIVTKIHALPGTTVSVGDPIATIASRDYASTLSDLTQAESEASAAATALARQKQLIDMGLAPRSSLEDAEVRASRANAMVRESRSATGAAAGSSGQSGTYVVRAPASGRLGTLTVRVGDNVNAMSPLAPLTTSTSLWIEFQIPARLIGQITAGDKVSLPGDVEGVVLSVTDTIDPRTRSAVAIAAAPANFIAFEGQLLRASLGRPAENSALVEAPARAVVQIAGADYVFRQSPDGFSPVPVNIIGKTAETATLGSGIQPGDAIATSGLTELKALAVQEVE